MGEEPKVNDPIYEIDRILDRRGGSGRPLEYLVSWSGYTDPTWIRRNCFVDPLIYQAFDEEWARTHPHPERTTPPKKRPHPTAQRPKDSELERLRRIGTRTEISSEDKTALLKILQTIKDMPEARHFIAPTDPATFDPPLTDYFDKENLKRDTYWLRFALVKDILLVFSNAVFYFGPGSPIGKDALHMKIVVPDLLAPVFKTQELKEASSELQIPLLQPKTDPSETANSLIPVAHARGSSIRTVATFSGRVGDKREANFWNNYCEICKVEWGILLCCEQCPKAVHAQCANVDADAITEYWCNYCALQRAASQSVSVNHSLPPDTTEVNTFVPSPADLAAVASLAGDYNPSDPMEVEQSNDVGKDNALLDSTAPAAKPDKPPVPGDVPVYSDGTPVKSIPAADVRGGIDIPLGTGSTEVLKAEQTAILAQTETVTETERKETNEVTSITGVQSVGAISETTTEKASHFVTEADGQSTTTTNETTLNNSESDHLKSTQAEPAPEQSVRTSLSQPGASQPLDASTAEPGSKTSPQPTGEIAQETLHSPPVEAPTDRNSPTFSQASERRRARRKLDHADPDPRIQWTPPSSWEQHLHVSLAKQVVTCPRLFVSPQQPKKCPIRAQLPSEEIVGMVDSPNIETTDTEKNAEHSVEAKNSEKPGDLISEAANSVVSETTEKDAEHLHNAKTNGNVDKLDTLGKREKKLPRMKLTFEDPATPKEVSEVEQSEKGDSMVGVETQDSRSQTTPLTDKSDEDAYDPREDSPSNGFPLIVGLLSSLSTPVAPVLPEDMMLVETTTVEEIPPPNEAWRGKLQFGSSVCNMVAVTDVPLFLPQMLIITSFEWASSLTLDKSFDPVLLLPSDASQDLTAFQLMRRLLLDGNILAARTNVSSRERFCYIIPPLEGFASGSELTSFLLVAAKRVTGKT